VGGRSRDMWRLAVPGRPEERGGPGEAGGGGRPAAPGRSLARASPALGPPTSGDCPVRRPGAHPVRRGLRARRARARVPGASRRPPQRHPPARHRVHSRPRTPRLSRRCVAPCSRESSSARASSAILCLSWSSRRTSSRCLTTSFPVSALDASCAASALFGPEALCPSRKRPRPSPGGDGGGAGRALAVDTSHCDLQRRKISRLRVERVPLGRRTVGHTRPPLPPTIPSPGGSVRPVERPQSRGTAHVAAVDPAAPRGSGLARPRRVPRPHQRPSHPPSQSRSRTSSSPSAPWPRSSRRS